MYINDYLHRAITKKVFFETEILSTSRTRSILNGKRLVRFSPPYAMLKNQTNIIIREHFELTSYCDIGTRWIKNRERREKKGVGDGY